jgi:DNA-binding GntR family transcriptional regulator
MVGAGQPEPPMNAPQVITFQHHLLHEQVAAKLRDMIISGELKADTAIDEPALCAEFKISRTPLREALKVLAAEDLVVLQPRRGAVVSKLTTASVMQKFEVVALIEGHAARLFCERRLPAALADLTAIHARLATAFRTRHRKQYSETNQGFHRGLVELTGNEELIRIHAQLLGHLQRARYFTGRQMNWRHDFMAEHDGIMAALTHDTPAAAETLVRDHLAHVARTVMEVVGA